jgi:serine/threonine protein kinase
MYSSVAAYNSKNTMTPSYVELSPYSRSSRFTHIKNLQAGGLLGSNNNGIHLVHDNVTHKLLIQKHLKPKHVHDGTVAREIDVLYQLQNHSNITQMVHYDLLPTPDQPTATIWTEFCNGGSLDGLLEKLRDIYPSGYEMPSQFLWHVFRSLVSAVHYCQHGPSQSPYEHVRHPVWNIVYHCDIQPSNVFLTYDGPCDGTRLPRVLLGDFGCAESLHDALITYGSGSEREPKLWHPDFVPPEAPSFNLRSDVYMIGLTMWCLMFQETDPHRDFELVQDDVLASVYPKALKELVAACLEFDPEDRLFIEQLDRSLWNEPEADQFGLGARRGTKRRAEEMDDGETSWDKNFEHSDAVDLTPSHGLQAVEDAVPELDDASRVRCYYHTPAGPEELEELEYALEEIHDAPRAKSHYYAPGTPEKHYLGRSMSCSSRRCFMQDASVKQKADVFDWDYEADAE